MSKNRTKKHSHTNHIKHTVKRSTSVRLAVIINGNGKTLTDIRKEWKQGIAFPSAVSNRVFSIDTVPTQYPVIVKYRARGIKKEAVL